MVHGLLIFIRVGGYFVFRLVFVVVAVSVCDGFYPTVYNMNQIGYKYVVDFGNYVFLVFLHPVQTEKVGVET